MERLDKFLCDLGIGSRKEVKEYIKTRFEIAGVNIELFTEDALNATIAARESGIIEGGGKVFYQLSNILLDLGVDELVEPILKNTLQTPFLQILENAGIKKEEILPTLTGDLWYDASTDEVVNNLEKGIIDPASVAISAVTNALSIAGIVLTTECDIIAKKLNGERR